MSTLDQAERNAEAHRTSFAVALEELDRRRKLVMDVPYQLRTHLPLVLLVGVVTAASVGTWFSLRRARQGDGRLRRRQALRRAALRAYTHPERIAVDGGAGRFALQLARKVALALAGSLVTQLARRTARVLLDRTALAEPPRLSERATVVEPRPSPALPR
ncbi:MAG: hypothetical protein ACYC8T_15080 [Myxococcaceae bacterium]